MIGDWLSETMSFFWRIAVPRATVPTQVLDMKTLVQRLSLSSLASRQGRCGQNPDRVAVKRCLILGDETKLFFLHRFRNRGGLERLKAPP